MNHPFCRQCRHKEDGLLRLVEDGNIRGVERALADGASIDGVGSRHGLPPLVLAGEGGLVKMLNIFLRRGANVDATASRMLPGCSGQQCQVVRVVAGSTALHMAVTHRKLDAIQFLLRSGGNPNLADSRGLTPLHVACNHFEGDVKGMVTILLVAGANPRLADSSGLLAIHYAAREGHTDVLDMLLREAPVTLNSPTPRGSTPLRVAAMHGQERMVMHLLRMGAGQPNEKVNSPLKAAVDYDRGGVVRLLLDHGMDAIGSAEFMSAALRSALGNGRAKSLGALLDYFDGDDHTRQQIASCSPGGLPVLHHAVSHGHLSTASVLLAAGADEAAIDKDGRLASEVVGSENAIDLATEEALLRMLERGPAFRAASWKWRASMSYPFRGRYTDPLGVRVFRRRNNKPLAMVTNRSAR